MKKSYTLTQLKYASEICWVEDFKKLWIKHATPELKDFWVVYIYDLKHKYNGCFITWVFSWSRFYLEQNDNEVENIICDILDDLLKDYKE